MREMNFLGKAETLIVLALPLSGQTAGCSGSLILMLLAWFGNMLTGVTIKYIKIVMHVYVEMLTNGRFGIS
jgi:hypothetical protein